MWVSVYWEMVEPVIKIKTLQARLASDYTIHLLNLKQQDTGGFFKLTFIFFSSF